MAITRQSLDGAGRKALKNDCLLKLQTNQRNPSLPQQQPPRQQPQHQPHHLHHLRHLKLRRVPQHRRRKHAPSGPASVAHDAMESFAAYVSILTGQQNHPCKCGVTRLDQAGRRSLSAAIFSTRRNSAAITKSWPATKRRPGNRCGHIKTRPVSSSRTPAPVHARHRHSATIVFIHSARPEFSTRSMQVTARFYGHEMFPPRPTRRFRSGVSRARRSW